jgi:hypothetical protein
MWKQGFGVLGRRETAIMPMAILFGMNSNYIEQQHKECPWKSLLKFIM